ncbi:hypothetical protein CRM22_000095 [Opisthorchis felineus]|uniref:Uncharacterized protein n=1 Tax=Opisthorchis felineus TaxID=147828 RepID=A0A4S2MNN0_OPIFE|nr:hypothetical protein CRM22_000095 [Opisthorchis felineus]
MAGLTKFLCLLVVLIMFAGFGKTEDVELPANLQEGVGELQPAEERGDGARAGKVMQLRVLSLASPGSLLTEPINMGVNRVNGLEINVASEQSKTVPTLALTLMMLGK